MQLFTPSVTLVGMCPSEQDDMLKHIERCGRVCYKSEENISDTSYIKFFQSIVKRQHFSVLGHSNIVIKTSAGEQHASQRYYFFKDLSIANTLLEMSPWVRLRTDTQNHSVYVHTSLRALAHLLLSTGRLGNLNLSSLTGRYYAFFYYVLHTYYPNIYECFTGINPCPYEMDSLADYFQSKGMDIVILNPDEQLQLLQTSFSNDFPAFTVKFITDRGISHELVRHQTLSVSQESTRYVNYSGKEIEFYNCLDAHGGIAKYGAYYEDVMNIFQKAEEVYTQAVGVSPQLNRNILPNALRTEVIMTGKWSRLSGDPVRWMGWSNFLYERCSKYAHPDAKLLADSLAKQFIKHYDLRSKVKE